MRLPAAVRTKALSPGWRCAQVKEESDDHSQEKDDGACENAKKRKDLGGGSNAQGASMAAQVRAGGKYGGAHALDVALLAVCVHARTSCCPGRSGACSHAALQDAGHAGRGHPGSILRQGSVLALRCMQGPGCKHRRAWHDGARAWKWPVARVGSTCARWRNRYPCPLTCHALTLLTHAHVMC
eukprot:356990-Chlamydomonas_euryale.AAC.7